MNCSSLATVALHLHAHLPYVRHPEYEDCALRRLEEAGRLEIVTCAATHFPEIEYSVYAPR